MWPEGRRHMLRVEHLRLTPDHTARDLEYKIRKYLRIGRTTPMEYRIFRQSIDARKKPDIFYEYTVDVATPQESAILRKQRMGVRKIQEIRYQAPSHGEEPLLHRPVIAGCGPAGLFCAWLLAKEGYRPLLLERGAPVEERIRDVQTFWESGKLNPQSNVSFGEGGAGTFSDGKLNTLVKDTKGRNRLVLESFVRFGAPEQILYMQKPHVGTDILCRIVRNMREEIQDLGGEIRFRHCLTGIHCQETGPKKELRQIVLNHTEPLEAQVLVLALGHSARDTFQMLYNNGLWMQAKSFAVGVRIEHPQQMIQQMQYGEKWAGRLPAASYKLAEKLENGRGVYTFCMCPGGYVVNASSQEGYLAVNGMSYHGRAGENANSAVIVTVTPDDFESSHPLAGVEFQRRLEQRAFQVGEGAVPVQCFGDFCRRIVTKEFGEIRPQIKGAFRFADVRSVFPEELAVSLEKGILAMDRRIPGFAREDALLSAVESRTSSPVRILRDENFEGGIGGIYPCGEGAGYAGGITSAAMDGLKTAEALIRRFSRPVEK